MALLQHLVSNEDFLVQKITSGSRCIVEGVCQRCHDRFPARDALFLPDRHARQAWQRHWQEDCKANPDWEEHPMLAWLRVLDEAGKADH